MLTFKKLRKANSIRNREWDPHKKITLCFRGTEIAETVKVCNTIKKLVREQLGLPGSRTTLEQLAEELADVVICADLIAMHVGIDLEESLRKKFNKSSEQNGLKTAL